MQGLINRPNCGTPKRKLTAAQEAGVADWVRAGPTLQVHKVVRWRCCDLRDEIARHFGVRMHERTVGKLLVRLNFFRVSFRPRHPEQDLEARQAHKKTSPSSSAPSFPNMHGTSRSSSGGKSEPGQKTVRGTVFPANARVGQQGSLTYVWAERGSRPRAPHDQRYTSAYLFGAVCPARGVGAALVLPGVNIAAMNLHLAEISSQVALGAHAVITLDGAGWHRPGGGLVVPDNISLLPLPPYAPEFNPVENIWQYLRQNYLGNRVFDTYGAILDACCDAWNALAGMPDTIRSIATRPGAIVRPNGSGRCLRATCPPWCITALSSPTARRQRNISKRPSQTRHSCQLKSPTAPYVCDTARHTHPCRCRERVHVFFVGSRKAFNPENS